MSGSITTSNASKDHEPNRRLPDAARINHLLTEICGNKVQNGSKNIEEDIYLTEDANQILFEHIDQITSTVVEGARNLALHRKSKEITIEDVQLILAKKMGIEIIGHTKLKNQLHHSLMKSTLNSSSVSELRNLNSIQPPLSAPPPVVPSLAPKPTVELSALGTKRKITIEEEYEMKRQYVSDISGQRN